MATSPSINIFKEIEGAILSGKFKPRERLTEMGLMAIYGVGRTVIRETLKKLEAKGLVTIIPFRGAVVTDLTNDRGLHFIPCVSVYPSFFRRDGGSDHPMDAAVFDCDVPIPSDLYDCSPGFDLFLPQNGSCVCGLIH